MQSDITCPDTAENTIIMLHSSFCLNFLLVGVDSPKDKGEIDHTIFYLDYNDFV